MHFFSASPSAKTFLLCENLHKVQISCVCVNYSYNHCFVFAPRLSGLVVVNDFAASQQLETALDSTSSSNRNSSIFANEQAHVRWKKGAAQTACGGSVPSRAKETCYVRIVMLQSNKYTHPDPQKLVNCCGILYFDNSLTFIMIRTSTPTNRHIINQNKP